MAPIRRSTIFLFCLLLGPLGLYAQYYNLGQDPASVHWKQLNTGHYRLIFPGGDDTEARRLAFLLESAYGPVSKGLDHRPKKTNVIFHQKSVISNGVVSWAPARMELFSCPPQESYAQEWLEQLSLHESRHVVQISRMNRGFTRGLNYILGQQASSLILGLFVPAWFMEGDAVVAETALSESGRGGYTPFESELRAQLVSNKAFSYDKAVYGSFKDEVPNHYILGYHIVAYGTTRFGKKIWENALEKTARKPFILTPFSRGIKEISGLSKDGLYRKAMQSLDSLWTCIDTLNISGNAISLSPAQALRNADYRFPALMGDGRIFALRSGMEDIPRFVSFIPGGQEKIIHTPGNINDESVVYHDGKILWTEEFPDLRWENRSYSRIKILDAKTGEIKTLGKRSRYFSPSPSADFSKIVAASRTENGQNAVVVLSMTDGRVLFHYIGIENEQFMKPVFHEDGKHILAVILGKNGKSLVELNTENAVLTTLLPPSRTEISGAVYHGEEILFIANYNGIDGIYAHERAKGTSRQVYAPRFGAKDIAICGNDSLLFADFQYGGHKAARCALKSPLTTKIVSPTPDYRTGLDSKLRSTENLVKFNDNNLQDSILGIKASPYRKLAHLFNFHSWSPFNLDASNLEINPGLMLLSQNMLSTSVLSLGYAYNLQEQTGRYKAQYAYLGLYPVIDVIFETGLRAFEVNPGDGNHRYTYNETTLELRISQPLNFTHNRFYRFIQPFAGYITEFVSPTSGSPEGLTAGTTPSLDFGFSAYNILRYSRMDIFPRWGQSLHFRTKQSEWGDYHNGTIYAGTAWAYFPGIWRHQGIRLGVAYQNDDGSNYSDMIRLPRGYSEYIWNDFFTASIDYALPLLYPDFSIPFFTYIKRLRADVFTDYGYQSFGNPPDFVSSGLELMADLYLFRFYAPIALGCRTTYVYHSGQWQTEILWGIGLGSYGGKEELRKFEP